MINTFQAGSLRVDIHPTTGVFTRLEHTRLGINLIVEPRLAENWRLQVPLPGRRGHFIFGAQQTLADVAWDGAEAVLRWRDLTSAEGRFDIEVALRLRFPAEDEIEFSLEVVNRSPHPIEAAYAPCLGGVRAPHGAPADWQLFGPRVISGSWQYPIFTEVVSSYHGPAVSNVLHPYPGGWSNPSSLGMPWVTLLNDQTRHGVYFGNQNPEIAYSAFWAEFNVPLAVRAETQAGFASFLSQTWPAAEEMGGEPFGATLGWIMFPFLAPGGQWGGPPLVCRFYEGGWWQAADRYRAWADTVMPMPDRAGSWLHQEDAWLAFAMQYNDGTVQCRAADLPRIAAETAAAGIRVLLLVGWSGGGLDGGYPDYEVDPRLGTPEEFAQAVAACHAAGVRVMLMANVAQVHVESEWFRTEGHRYVVRNRAGDYYHAGGVWYGFQTVLDQLGYTVPQMMTANPAHPEFRAHILRSIDSLRALGVDGVLLDKVNTGDPYCLDFNPAVPGSPDSSFHRALAETVAASVEQAHSQSPDFRFALESGWDRMMPFTEAAYTRYFEQDHAPLSEYLYPEVRQTNCVVSDLDFSLANNCLRFGHVICFEPRYYHGILSDLPRLTRHVQEVLRVRRALRPLLWDGRVVPADFAAVTGRVLAGVFEAAGPGPRQVALVLNHFGRAAEPVEVAFPGGPWTHARLYRPYREPEDVRLPVVTTVPADEFLVVVPGPEAAPPA